MNIAQRHNPDGTVDLLVNGKVAVAGETPQVIDNIAWALRNQRTGVYDVSEADEIAYDILTAEGAK